VINAIKFSIEEIEASDQYFDHTGWLGRIDPKPDDAGFSCHIEYVVPPDMPLITGPGPVAIATPVSITFDLPQNFAEGPVIGIQTPFGPLNVKFAKIRDLDL
jgi:hypothetical protein